jgi:hypothetical protein
MHETIGVYLQDIKYWKRYAMSHTFTFSLPYYAVLHSWHDGNVYMVCHAGLSLQLYDLFVPGKNP